MCGIVGLYLKRPALEPQLGALFSPMLACMSSRGPDSAGLAIYGTETPAGFLKISVQHPQPEHDWDHLTQLLRGLSGSSVERRILATHAIFTVRAEEDALRSLLAQEAPEVTVMSVGRRIEIIKEVGTPASVLERFQVPRMQGSHAIGHTRMATESAVTTAGSHPFSTGLDLCLVHNGSLSNHNRLRTRLQREGFRFSSQNDSEVAAGYLTWQLQRGAGLEGALEAALQELDGFYTFAIGTRDGFAVVRDAIACKPAVLAETEAYVAMASEYRSLASLPGIEQARVWEPEPATIYSWSRRSGAECSAAPTQPVACADLI